MKAHKSNSAQIDELVFATRQMLRGFLLSPHAYFSEEGYIDLPLFGFRFSFVDPSALEEIPLTIILVKREEDLDSDDMFVELARRGYLAWLRQKTKDSHFYYTVLQHKDRWRVILEHALERAVVDKQGEFRIGYLQSLLSQSFQQIYHRDPTIFDWILS